MPPFAHEPVVTTAPDGSHLLYHIGGPNCSRPPFDNCAAGYTRAGDDPRDSFVGPIPNSILRARSLTAAAAAWQRVPGNIGSGDMNPAPFVWPNGTVVMLGRDCLPSSPPCTRADVFLARSPRWDVMPYEVNRSSHSSIFADWVVGHAPEDPFL